MPVGSVLMKVGRQEQYRALSRRLREQQRGDLQRKLTRAIRTVGSPAVTAAQAAWRTVDVTPPAGAGRKSTGLRARVAAATRVSILQSGISIRVEPSKVDPRYGKSLSYGLDGLGRWRHPVYGNQNVWTQQYGQEVFFKTLERFETAWQAGIERAMEDAARQIEG